MFGFRKKKQQDVIADENQKKKSHIDKLVMGAIIGGAIGSVVGMSIAPKKGKETREYLARRGRDIIDKGKELSGKVNEEIHRETRHSDHHGHQKNDGFPEVVDHQPKAHKGLFSWLREKLLHRRTRKKTRFMVKEGAAKKIPHEIK